MYSMYVFLLIAKSHTPPTKYFLLYIGIRYCSSRIDFMLHLTVLEYVEEHFPALDPQVAYLLFFKSAFSALPKMYFWSINLFVQSLLFLMLLQTSVRIWTN